MELTYWWLSLLLFAAIVVAFFLVKRHSKKHPSPKSAALPLANSYRLTKLPEYQQLLRRYRWLLGGVLAFSLIAVLMSIINAGRPTTSTVTTPSTKNRDIMLCLDVSGSMQEADATLTKIYASLAKDFDGERIGLVVFDSSPVTVFPLTNDYTFVQEQLTEVSRVLGALDLKSSGPTTTQQLNDWSEAYDKIFSGTSEGNGASLIGDGLAGCVNRFDHLDSKRSRSIIFGTDNYVSGTPIVTLSEAADIAKSKDVRVYGFNPSDTSRYLSQTKESIEYKKAMLTTGGDYYQMDNTAALAGIVQKITAQDATRFTGTPHIVYTDKPAVFLYLLLACLAIVIVGRWRYKL